MRKNRAILDKEKRTKLKIEEDIKRKCEYIHSQTLNSIIKEQCVEVLQIKLNNHLILNTKINESKDVCRQIYLDFMKMEFEDAKLEFSREPAMMCTVYIMSKSINFSSNNRYQVDYECSHINSEIFQCK